MFGIDELRKQVDIIAEDWEESRHNFAFGHVEHAVEIRELQRRITVLEKKLSAINDLVSDVMKARLDNIMEILNLILEHIEMMVVIESSPMHDKEHLVLREAEPK